MGLLTRTALVDNGTRHPGHGVLDVRGVIKRYEQKGASPILALDFVDLRVDQGDFVVVTGRSGSGKTTLLNAAAGLSSPTSGKVLLGGADLWALPDAERTRLRNARIGFVFQFPSLLPTHTVLENVLLPAHLKPGRLAAGAQTRALQLLDSVGLGERLSARPAQLSAGQQQRAVIARALINEPELLIADEPTSNLDEHTEDEIMSLFHQINRDLGVTIVMVTHSSSLVEYGSRHIRMAEGRVVSETRPSDLYQAQAI